MLLDRVNARSTAVASAAATDESGGHGAGLEAASDGHCTSGPAPSVRACGGWPDV